MNKEIEFVECRKCGKQTSNHRGYCLYCDAKLEQEKEARFSIDERDVGSSCKNGDCPVR